MILPGSESGMCKIVKKGSDLRLKYENNILKNLNGKIGELIMKKIANWFNSYFIIYTLSKMLIYFLFDKLINKKL